ncbi:ATP-binding protein [Sinosporangium siamense]|uniref:NB-ARC domain-containing protein n=1 Tax=Sinosporangium siamense TaxID=1367973 RepID=A0A919RFU0_9ACTN|nr:tetratricopeptide repeat protein [Sinosporangium siamense]GII93115.1 hypothetical protein Ssi02_33460 [Sinosporangium siamense]
MQGQEPAPTPDPPSGDSQSILSGNASDVVQARDVYGGVHFQQAARQAPRIPRELPRDVRGFVNRGHELTRLEATLDDHEHEGSAVTIAVIVGTAGVGKTSLALHWAHRAKERFPDGQLYVNLRGYDPGPPLEAAYVLERFLRALGVEPAAIPSDLDDRSALYRSLLAGRRLLVVLDNAVTAGQIRPLLPGAAGCLVLITSRNRLSALVARDGAERLTLGILPEQDAIALLRRVTDAYRGGDDPDSLAELSRLCAGLPLALRIAAERAASRPWMPLSELIADLRDESGLWEALTVVDGEEADAVRGVFAWSYRALPEEAARLFRTLGVHPGADFSTAAAAAVAGTDEVRVRPTLDLLAGAHLVEQHRPGRYQFHDLLRAYAIDQIEREETAASRRVIEQRLYSWYTLGAAAARAHIVPGPAPIRLSDAADEPRPPAFPDYDAAMAWYEAERSNLVDVVRSAFDTGHHATVWRLSAVLKEIYARLNEFQHWFEVGQRGLDAARLLGDRYGEAENLDGLAMAYTQAQRSDKAIEYAEAALAVYRELGDRQGEARSRNRLGLVHLRAHRLREAQTHFTASAAIYAELNEPGREAVVSGNLGQVHAELGEHELAATMLEAALASYRSQGNAGSEGNALRLISMNLRRAGRPAEALPYIEDAIAIAQAHRNQMWEGFWLIELGEVQCAAGRFPEALISCQRSAVIQRTIGDRTREALAWSGTGRAYQGMERHSEAADFHRRAAAVHRDIGHQWFLALALGDLAAALHALGAEEEAARHGREALGILSRFDDPESMRRQEAIKALLPPAPGSTATRTASS